MELDFSMPLSQLNIESSEAIAVVGMAVQIGAAASEEEFWQMLCRGEDMIRDFPDERRSEIEPFRQRLYGKAPYVPRAYLPQISQFDADYFHLTPLEAQMMSPEQRLFMESAFSCLQNAGYESSIRGSRTGVYVGYSAPDLRYEQLIDMGMGDTDYAAGVKISGNVESMIAARVSYLLDLQGPAMVINTACSSSLSAIHLACNAIKAGEIDAALVGAVKIYLVPGTVAEGNGGVQIASSSARTRTFDAQADGTGGGEGVITLLLKPLSLALADGDHIRAVIRGSRLNQDGTSMGITAPNPDAQARLLRECWRECGIEPEELSYLEAHGTGTKLGDPMELEAITKAFADYTSKRQFCAIGSVKSNVGHLDCAAGLAGIAKAILMLEKGKIPPTLHFQAPNSQIDFIHSPVYVCDKLEDWDPPYGRKCGVSSFGISGTNGHVVLEEAPKRETQSVSGEQLLLISGQTEECLLENWRRLRDYARAEQPNLRDFCYSAAVGRDHRPYRAAIVLRSLEQFVSMKPSMENGCYFGVCKPSKTAVPADGDLHALAQGYVKGENYRFEDLYCGASRLALPPYSFDRRSYWVDHHALQVPVQKLAPCIDEHIELSDGSSVFRYHLSTAQCWELREHTLEGTHILPGTVYIEMMLEAGQCLFEDEGFVLQDVMFLTSYACKTDELAELQIMAQPKADGFAVSIRSKKQGQKSWESHAEGILYPSTNRRPQPIEIAELLAQKGGAQTIERQNNGPIKISPRWLSLDQLWKTEQTMTAHFTLQEQYRGNLQSYQAYPSLLDGAVNAANILHNAGFCLPFSYKKAAFFRPLPPSFYSRAEAYPENRMQEKIFTYDVTLYTDSGEVIAQIEGYTLKKVEQLGDVLHEKRYHQIQWIEKAAPVAQAPKKLLLLCSPEQENLPLLKEVSQRVQTVVWTWDGKWNEVAVPTGVDQIVFCLGYRQTEQENVSLYQSLYEFLQKTGSLPVGCGFTILTANAAPVEGTTVLATHAGLLGMAKSLCLEWPKIRVIDADENLTADELLQELSQSNFCAAWRAHRRFVEKMLPYQPKNQTVSFKNDGTYVITGGFGGMGSTFWHALHSQCPNAHIALLSRSETVQELPGNVTAYCVDVADRAQLEACFDRIRAEHPPIRGVIHTAGVAGGQFLAMGNWESFEKVLRPKVQGTWNLVHCTQNLDFFVLCSSLSAVFGATGQSDYTAANAFMDGMAHALRKQGKPAVSINWSGWKDVGMAVNNGVDPLASPLAFLTPQKGWQSLLTALACDEAQILVGTVMGALTANTLDLSAYQHESKTVEPTQKIRVMGKGGAPLTQTEQRVAEAWAQTLGLQEVQLHEPFFDAGGSSLLISYLFKKLDEAYPGVIDITGLFVHDTIANIAAYIDSRMGAEEDAPLEQIEQDVESLVGQFVSGSLSEDELEALLETLS